MKQKRFGSPGSLLCCSIILGASLVASNALASTISSWNEIGFTNPAPNIDPDLGFYTGSSAYISDGDGGGISVTNATDKNCITSSGTTCTDPRKSGKRIKISATDNGPIDLVFNLDLDKESTGEYTVASKILNRTGTPIENVTLELGFGSGDSFFFSDKYDGVNFVADSAFSKFSHGLFGGVDDKHAEDGFYDSSISEFTLNDIHKDKIQSDGIFGYYGDNFGSMLDISQVPDGSFIPAELDGEEDTLVRAPDPANPGKWLYDDDWDAKKYANEFDITKEGYYDGIIEDLAQANFTFSILTGDFEDGFWANMSNMQGLSLDEGFYNTFTLRITTTAAAAPVPEPATMLLFGIGLVGLAGYRQKQKK